MVSVHAGFTGESPVPQLLDFPLCGTGDPPVGG